MVIEGLQGILGYLDDVIAFDADPDSHVRTMNTFFARLRKHDLKLSSSKARVGTTTADFLGHSISPAGVQPNADKVSALTNMPAPRGLKGVRSLLGGLSYYRKFLPDLSKRLRPVTTLLRQGVQFVYTEEMENVVRSLLKELSRPPILAFPDRSAVEDNSRPFLLYCDASIDGFGATLEQQQEDGTVRPLLYISRATLPAERNWTPLELEAGAIVWAIKRLRSDLYATISHLH